ncbi:MAG: hypothetical protein IJ712_05875, partial [Anaerovibrio sp.]|nr:hypothetical protein [Anaerovibrio sp.]
GDLKQIIINNDTRSFSIIGDFLNKYSEKKFSFPFFNSGINTENIIKTLSELKEAPFYQSALSPYSTNIVREIADTTSAACVNIALSKGIKAEFLSTNSDELNRYLLAALLFLQQRDFGEALRCLLIYASYGESLFHSFPHLFYYRGLAYYGLHEYEKARDDLENYLQMNSNDEIGYFHLGNVYLRMNKIQHALDAYTEALKNRSNFDEILFNADIIDKKITANGDSLDGLSWPIIESPMTETLKIADSLVIWDIPIFINNFNRLGCLQKLVDWLLQAGYRCIFILDNDSSYGPLLQYYDQLEKKDNSVKVLRLGQNMGYKALWDSGILEKLNIETPYVYTDSDVVPSEQCPKDVLLHLLNILRKYSFLKKVGLGLVTEDITFFDSNKIKENEKRFYIHEMEENLYFGAVDTTFALYRNYRHYNIYVSARTTGKYMARHLPWYYDYQNLPEDEIYYAEHANASASLIDDLRKRGILNGI